MPVFSFPEIKDVTRAELELHIASVASKRMEAAILYNQRENVKLSKQASDIDKKLDIRYKRLANLLQKMTADQARCDKLMNEINALNTDLSLTTSMMTLSEVEANNKD